MTETRRQLESVEGIADYLGTTPRHIRGLVHRRAIPFVRVGRLIRFRVTEIDTWIDGHAVPDAGANR